MALLGISYSLRSLLELSQVSLLRTDVALNTPSCYLLASYRAHGDGGVLAPGGAAAVHLQQVLLPPPLAPQAQVLIIRPGQAGEVKLTLPQVKLHLRPVPEALVWRGRGGSSVHVDNVLGGVIVLMCITVGLSSD